MIKDRPVPSFVASAMFEMHGPARLVEELRIISSGTVSTGDSVIDIGCGPGHLSAEMARVAGPDGMVHALDIHPMAIESTRSLAASLGLRNVNAILTDRFETGLEAGTLDAAFIFNAIGMIRDKARLADELHKILKPGARLVIRNKMGAPFSTRAYARLFAEYGFSLSKKEGKALFFEKL